MNELTQLKKGDTFDWPGLTYCGHDVFELVYENGLIDEAEIFLEEDRQESYLGYNPLENAFYMGFDTWLDDESEDGDNCLRFRFREDGSLITVELFNISGSMMYPEGYDHLHALMPELIDIRLD